MATNRNPRQESLLVVSEPTGQMKVRNFHESDKPAVDVIERDLHLMNVLHHLSAASMRDGLLRVGEGALLDRYGEHASKVVQGAERKRKEHMHEAKLEFARAIGFQALLKSGYSKEQVKVTAREMYDEFLGKYYGMHNHQANHAYRKQLKQAVDVLAEKSEKTVSVFNRRYGYRPHRTDKLGEQAQDNDPEELDRLDAAERLQAVYEDPRAGFLPKTSRELTRVMAWLDYLDNPDKELGIIHQLREVFVRAQAPSGRGKPYRQRLGVRGGVRAIESIAWEVGDDLLEAASRLQAVVRLREAISQDQRPTLMLFDEFSAKNQPDGDETLQEIFGGYALALASLVQYRDLVMFMENGVVMGLDDSPLMATEDPPRSVRPKWSVEPGKRKTIRNQYTRPDMQPEFKRHIIDSLRSMTFKQARALAEECEDDLRREVTFLARRMQEMKKFRTGPIKPLQDALQAIDQQIQQFSTVA